jgi:hypothetical protein
MLRVLLVLLGGMSKCPIYYTLNIHGPSLTFKMQAKSAQATAMLGASSIACTGEGHDDSLFSAYTVAGPCLFEACLGRSPSAHHSIEVAQIHLQFVHSKVSDLILHPSCKHATHVPAGVAR